MRRLVELGAVDSWRWDGTRYLLAIVFAVVLGLAAAVPVFAADDADYHAEVVGGSAVPDGKYPFMVSLQADTSSARPHGEHFCGGSLIDTNSVLTAGHCVDFISAATTPATLSYKDVRIVVGVTSLNSRQGQVRRIERLSAISIHPRYNGKLSSKYDAAVIKLGRSVTMAPISLAGPGSNGLERAGRMATITGWGNTKAQPANGSGGRNFPDRIRKARVPIVSDAGCKRTYGGEYSTSHMVCAGKKGVDTCQGDSGGPMWAISEAGLRRQIGITSFGYGCATARYPGVYTEVNAPEISSFIRKAANR